jgi:TRAP transporter TAXI family solute receptor
MSIDLACAAKPREFARLLVVLFCTALPLADLASAQQAQQTQQAESRRRAAPAPAQESDQVLSMAERINSNTVYVVSGNLNGTYLSIAYDLSAVLDDGNELRILPVVGKGGGQNIRDVRFLKGVDIGITQSNLLSLFRRTGEIGPIDDKIVYIARLFNEELHLIVRAESGITSIEQLAGKKVNFSDIGSGTQLSTRDIFERLGIKAVEVNMGQNDGFEALKRGDIAATALIAGKPAGSTVKLRAADGYRILPVPFPKSLQNDYLPTVLTNDDYPGLIEPGKSVDTIAVGAVLIAYNWPQNTDRYRRIAKFVDTFFPRIAEFHKPPRHPKWREANLAATVPGWKRLPAAEEWVKRNQGELQQSQSIRDQFDQFLATRDAAGKRETMSREQFESLFREFMSWRAQTRDRR